jgi:hypothetical protein
MSERASALADTLVMPAQRRHNDSMSPKKWVPIARLGPNELTDT